MKMAYLLDFYGDALDEHVRSVMRAYYNDDLSLSEIALGEGISRQGVRHLIKKGEESLNFFEEKLSLAKNHDDAIMACELLNEVKKSISNNQNLKEETRLLERAIEIITKGNWYVPEPYWKAGKRF